MGSSFLFTKQIFDQPGRLNKEEKYQTAKPLKLSLYIPIQKYLLKTLLDMKNHVLPFFPFIARLLESSIECPASISSTVIHHFLNSLHLVPFFTTLVRFQS